MQVESATLLDARSVGSSLLGSAVPVWPRRSELDLQTFSCRTPSLQLTLSRRGLPSSNKALPIPHFRSYRSASAILTYSNQIDRSVQLFSNPLGVQSLAESARIRFSVLALSISFKPLSNRVGDHILIVQNLFSSNRPTLSCRVASASQFAYLLLVSALHVGSLNIAKSQVCGSSKSMQSSIDPLQHTKPICIEPRRAKPIHQTISIRLEDSSDQHTLSTLSRQAPFFPL